MNMFLENQILVIVNLISSPTMGYIHLYGLKSRLSNLQVLNSSSSLELFSDSDMVIKSHKICNHVITLLFGSSLV